MREIAGIIFSNTELVILIVLFGAFLHQLYYYIRYIKGVLRYRNHLKKNKDLFITEQPPISVIICAKDEADNLRKFLPFVLQQDYPNYEVIVINDGSTDETDDLLREFCKNYSNLRTTFVPVGANNLSTKKLGLTLGIKAASNELLLFTDADCMPEDKMWIAKMARNFDKNVEFVLGYGAYLQKKGLLNKLITYDTLFIALQYLGMAAAGKPYMGVGRNLAYRKETFFNNKGFASTLNLKSGDDDLMVNKSSNKNNTRIEISPESITWSEPKTTYKGWFFQKERHMSVSSYYTAKSKYRLMIEPLSRAVFYSSILAIAILGNIYTIIAGVTLFSFRLLFQLIIINSSAKYFRGKTYFFTLPIFDIFLPLVSLYIVTIGRITSKGKSIKWK